jgi:hypothetical protein
MNISPEIELLLLCSGTCSDRQHAERIRKQAATLKDWDRLVRTASFHKVIPLLYLNLKKHAPGLVPPRVMKRLKVFFQTTSMRNLLMARVLVDVLDLLDRENVLAIPFKGPVLAWKIYGDISKRSFNDLDLLIEREDFYRTTQILAANGFRPCVELDQ